MDIAALHTQIAAVCPINGISIGLKDDPETWRIDFADEATEAQKAAATGFLGAYNPRPLELIAYAQNARWQKETGGIQFAGIPVATDDRSKLMITGARVAADADADWTTIWQGGNGAGYTITAPEMIALSNAVSAHVSACFAIYAEVKASIDAGAINTEAAIDAAFDW